MKICIIGGSAPYLVHFRGALIREWIGQGHEVLACTGDPDLQAQEMLESWGARYEPLLLSRAGLSPLQDARFFLQLRRILARFSPTVVFCYSIKSVIWGGFAARSSGVPRIYSLIPGLGFAFMPGRGVKSFLVHRAACLLYRASLKHSEKVFLQNPDDLRELTGKRIVDSDKCIVVNGSGVDLDQFRKEPFPPCDRQEGDEPPGKGVVFLMVARLLKDKGVCEYVEVARRLKQEGGACVCRLAGAVDANPASISQAEVDAWVRGGYVDYLGHVSDVQSAYKNASVYVLPSYREGTPRTVLEAMATGRPIITTDAPGCRETVRLTVQGLEQKEQGRPVMEGENGFLVRARDADALEQAMRRFIDDPDLMVSMGAASRRIAEEKYDVRKVNAVMMEAMALMAM